MIIVSNIQDNFTQNLEINLKSKVKLHEINFFIDCILYLQIFNG